LKTTERGLRSALDYEEVPLRGSTKTPHSRSNEGSE